MQISCDVFLLIFMGGGPTFFEALANVNKFENCLTSFIRINGFCIFKNKLTLLFCSETGKGLVTHI